MSDKPNYTMRDWIEFFVIGAVAGILTLFLFFVGLRVIRATWDEPVPSDPVETPVVIVEEAVPVAEAVEAPVETPVPVETPAPVETEAQPEMPEYSEQELEMLAMVIYQEAGGDACSNECRQMVGEVVLNRVADSRFPNTIYEVISAPYQYGRLHWRFDWPERAQNPGEEHAVLRAYDIAAALLTNSVERLLPEDTVFQAEFPQGKETIAQVNGLYFCR